MRGLRSEEAAKIVTFSAEKAATTKEKNKRARARASMSGNQKPDCESYMPAA
jgi:hypothetical protein